MKLTSPKKLFLLPLLALGVLPGCDPKIKPADQNNATASAAKPFVVVKQGYTLPLVVVPANATPKNREAAKELIDSIKAITGTTLELIEADPSNAPPRAIWIGMQPGLENLFSEFDLALTKPEQIRIISTPDHLLIAGRDVYDPDNMKQMRTSGMVEDFQKEYGTANAVYTFLQDSLGVRWLFPGPLGVDYPEASTLTVPATDVSYAPQFLLRSGIFYQHAQGSSRDATIKQWSKHQRMLLDSLQVDIGHPFIHWWEKYGATRPELFALMPDGTRGTHPQSAKTKKFCDGERLLLNCGLRN